MTVNESSKQFVKDFDMIHEKLKSQKEKEKEEEEIGKLFVGIMEGYKDSVIPALSELKSLVGMENYEKGSSSLGKRARIDEATDQNESLLKERVRREKMAEKFSVLQSMVPSLVSNPKTSRETIVTDTINYIRSLEKETARLEELKRSMLLQKQIGTKPALSGCTKYLKPSVTSTVFNDIAFFGVQLIVKRGSLSKIFEIFQKYHAEVFEVTIFVNDHRMLTLTGTFTVEGDGHNVVEKIKKEILVL